MTAENAQVEEPLRIGKRKQLFVDDYIVAERSNVVSSVGNSYEGSPTAHGAQ